MRGWFYTSRMLNTRNQQLSGGHFKPGETWLDQSYEAIYRVKRGLKPVAAITTLVPNSLDKIIKYVEKINLEISPVIITPRGCHQFLACRKNMPFGERFDLSGAALEYSRFGINITPDFDAVKDRYLLEFVVDWDYQDEWSRLKPWMTGMLLGYPIYETLKRCYGMKFV